MRTRSTYFLLTAGIAISALLIPIQSTLAVNKLLSVVPSQLTNHFKIAGNLEEQVKAEIDTKIKNALSDTRPEIKLEGDVALMLQKNGYRIFKFQHKYYLPNTKTVDAEIDIETAKVFIEVTTVTGGKNKQVGTKSINNSVVNPSKKAIILYAPNYTSAATSEITALGAHVVKKPSELFAKMSEIGAK